MPVLPKVPFEQFDDDLANGLVFLGGALSELLVDLYRDVDGAGTHLRSIGALPACALLRPVVGSPRSSGFAFCSWW